MLILILGGFHMWKEIFLNAATAIGVTMSLLVLTDVFAILGAFFRKKKAEAEEALEKMQAAVKKILKK